MFVCCMFLELGFWSCLELQLDLNSSGSFLVLMVWSKLLSPSVSLCPHVLCVLLTCCLVFFGWAIQPSPWTPFSKRKCAAQPPEALEKKLWLITSRVQKTTPPRNFLSL